MMRVGAVLLVVALAMAACGGDDGGSDGDALSGIVREPAPAVDGTALPSTAADELIEFRARPGGLQVVYFGYTNCPDVCPTTLADLTVALRKLSDEQAAMVDTVMVTVDPDRDLDRLTEYVQSFVPDARGAGTDDAALLAEAAEPFGVVYDVRTLDDGTVEVEHSPFLYVVNDQGELVLSWQFGESSDNMAADLASLLERQGVSA
jgi:protein SCO1/2